MIFEQNTSIGKIGVIIGYIFSFFLFTTILFFILLLLNKISESWTYFHAMGIVILIALIGAIINKLLR